MRRHPSRPARASTLLFRAAAAATAVGLTLGPAGVAFAAAPSPTPTAGASGAAGNGGGNTNVGPQKAGEAGCALPTSLDEVTGMVATQKGIYVVEGGTRIDPPVVTIVALDAACKATPTNYTGPNPLDPQDLAIASDGTAFYVADTGDTIDGDPDRTRIAVEKAPIGGGKANIYRFQYPGGTALDAEAMLLNKGDIPVILAHDAGGKTGIYTVTQMPPADDDKTMGQLTKVGEFTPAKTNTPNPKGALGEAIVTGANKAPDGKHVVIRTLSDAYEFEVGADGDVVKAITGGKAPAITPLPNEVQGEAITYSADGTKFITLSTRPQNSTTAVTLLTYARYVPPPPQTAQAEQTSDDSGGGQSFLQRLSFSELTRIVAAVGVVGLVLAIAGIIGIRRARRRRREEDDYDDYDDYDDEPRSRRGRGRRDDGGYAGPREPAYSAGYEDPGGYSDAGYGGNGYGGYAANGYGGGYEAGYGASADNGYGQYGAGQYGAGQYGAGQYSAGQYGDYSGQGYGGQGSGDYSGQGYGDYAGQGQYGGYGYEEDFDPMQDPRRR